ALACASTGNTAASLAAYGALAALPVLVFVPAGKIARGKLAQAVAYGANVIEVDGDFDSALSLVQEVCTELGVALLNSINPYRIEGQKSAAFEIVQAFGGSAPDWVVLPAGNLGNISAYGKAFHELQELGILQRVPRLAGIQAEGANPFYLSYQTGFTRRYRVKAETVATAIRIGDPASHDRALRALKWTDGVVEQVSDEEILLAKSKVDGSGIGCEPASAASVAGVRKLRAKGLIRPDETVVAVLTGHLLKDPEIVLNKWEEKQRVQIDARDRAKALRQVSELLERKMSEDHHA
ncbi:MAG TPA: threonine synthase, partial [Bacteroidetes bacterium]|nr:threonine synthase [Bacteroidota bacterium]